MMKKKLQLVINSGKFLNSFENLPKQQQRLVKKLLEGKKDLSTAGRNLEKIRGARDPSMRSVRIDDNYRAIIHKPNPGNVYFLLWVDKHDAAYAWAKRHELGVHPDTGILQIYDPQPMSSGGSVHGNDSTKAAGNGVRAATTGPPGIFDDLRDRQLLRIGVPKAMLPSVRNVRNDDDLEVLEQRMPPDAYNALYGIYCGCYSYEETIRQLEVPDTPVDPANFEAALARAGSRAQFVVIDEDVELKNMLNAPLDRWRVFLHQSQRRLVERDWNGPVRVLGGAGTGKTVAALHRARWLARTLPPDARILFTTFTRNLAADIEQHLRSICTAEEADRIEVTNLNRWVRELLAKITPDYRLTYGHDSQHQTAAWKEAMKERPVNLNLPDTFYRNEWKWLIVPAQITNADDYRRVPRKGLGVRLTRSQRDAVWPVFLKYADQLREHGLLDFGVVCNSIASLIARRKGVHTGYEAVIVDEAQDFEPPAYRLLRALVPEGPNDLFIVGDGHQRIYHRPRVVLSRCGINIRGRSRKLRFNYRTTEQTRRWAASLLDECKIDNLDGGRDDNTGIMSATRGPKPQIHLFETRQEQARFLVDYLTDLRGLGDPLQGVCVTARTHKECDHLEDALRKGGLPSHRLGGDAEDPATDGVRIATMHRVKGLEFDRMVIASANDDLLPLPAAIAEETDDAERTAAETAERALVYVAATRAKKELIVLAFGNQSPFLRYAEDETEEIATCYEWE